MKLKIIHLGIKSHPVHVKERKPDKRFLCGYRETDKLIPKLSVSIDLRLTHEPILRLREVIMIPQINNYKFMIVAIDKTQNQPVMDVRSVSYIPEDQFLLSLNGEYVDAVSLCFVAAEGRANNV